MKADSLWCVQYKLSQEYYRLQQEEEARAIKFPAKAAPSLPQFSSPVDSIPAINEASYPRRKLQSLQRLLQKRRKKSIPIKSLLANQRGKGRSRGINLLGARENGLCSRIGRRRTGSFMRRSSNWKSRGMAHGPQPTSPNTASLKEEEVGK